MCGFTMASIGAARRFARSSGVKEQRCLRRAEDLIR
jgi:hypothetical protein